MIRVLDRQSLLDIAVQVSGSMEAVFDLSARNGLSITGKLPAGLELQESEIINRNIAAYYAGKRLTPATEMDWDTTGEGIEFWAVEYDFTVS